VSGDYRKGTIILDDSLQAIAKGALQIRLGGMRTWRGRTPRRLSKALEIRLSGLRAGSTVLEVECDTFQKTLMGEQGDVFRPQILDELPSLSPVGLVVQSFLDALRDGSNEEYLDKPLLQELQNFKFDHLNNGFVQLLKYQWPS
jgi:hypothetical protein